MSVVIPDEIVESTKMSEQELRQEIAILLFERKKLTLEQSSHLAGMDQLQFQHVLASRQIPLHYGVDDLKQDIKALEDINQT